MRYGSTRVLAALLAWVVLGLCMAQPAAADVDVKAAGLSLPGVTLRDVDVHLGTAEGGISVTLTAARAVVPALGWRRVALQWNGTVRREGPQRWVMEGKARLRNAPGGLLGNGMLGVVIDAGANTLEITLGQGQGQASAALPLDMPTHAQIHLDKIPLRWLQGLLASAWEGGRLSNGVLSGRFAVDMLDSGLRSSGEFSLSGGGFDSQSGMLAGQALRVGGNLRLESSDGGTRIDLDASMRGGDVLLGPLYASLPSHAVRLSLSARSTGAGLRLRNIRFNDPGALQVEGRVDFSPQADLQRLDLTHVSAHFPEVYNRYGKTWLATLGIDRLKARGIVNGHLDMGAKGPVSFAIATDGLDMDDGGGRFAVEGLSGGLDWDAEQARPLSTLSWKRLRLFRIVNGAATSQWRSEGGVLSLQQPLQIPTLGGQLRIPSLDWRPAAQRGQRLDTSIILTGIHMRQLCKAFGWPEFKGTLGGAIPGLRYVDDRFVLDGGLSLNVFNGFVDVTRLSIQQPFGSTPVLAGDMHMDRLDLGAITSVFDFGRITGNMHGKVENLRLVNWTPVSFDAELLADDGGRISQRAVNNLTSVGGGGVAAGLQGAVLKLFDSFSYRRIGLRCRLQGAVCHMSGLGPQEGGGFAIVEGRGLPRLNVIGHQTRVSWPTLVSRLKAAIEGGGPVVN